MDDDKPPPLPPKLKNVALCGRYTREEYAKAIEEEEEAYEKIRGNLDRTTVKKNYFKDPLKNVVRRPLTPQNLLSSDTNSENSPSHSNSDVLAYPHPKPRSTSLKISAQGVEKSKITHSASISALSDSSQDLMCFHSPEKTNNEILQLLQSVNARQNLVPKNVNVLLQSNISVSDQVLSKPLVMTGSSIACQNDSYSANRLFSTNFNIRPAYSGLVGPMTSIPPILNFNYAQPNRCIVPSTSNGDNSNTTPTSDSKCSVNKDLALVSVKPKILNIPFPENRDLIDLDCSFQLKNESKTSSLLDDFDPLVIKEQAAATTGVSISQEATDMLRLKISTEVADDETSYYEQVDPFDYMYAGSSSSRSDPISNAYDGLISGATYTEAVSEPPPLPPRTELRKLQPSPKTSQKLIAKKRSGIILDDISSFGIIQISKTPSLSADSEASAFWERIKARRMEFSSDDYIGNPGLLHSPCLENLVDSAVSIKLKIYYENRDPATFTCNLDATIEHVLMQTIVMFELGMEANDYLLKVRGIDEYLSGASQLADYEYVHNCIKYDQDVKFSMISCDKVAKSYIRTVEDDVNISEVKVEDLMTSGSGDVIYFHKLSIVIDAINKEVFQLQNSGFLLISGTPAHELPSSMHSKKLRQIVKQMCALLGEIETTELSESLSVLTETCRTIQKSQGILDGEDDPPGQRQAFSTGSYDSSLPDELKTLLLDSLSQLAESLNNFLLLYVKAFRVDFEIEETAKQSEDVKDIRDMDENFSVNVCGLHRLNMEWNYDEYFVEANLYYGSMLISKSIYSPQCKATNDPRYYKKIIIDKWLELNWSINMLPRESRLVFTVFGLKIVQADSKSENFFVRDELGWCAVQLFSFNGFLVHGKYLLSLWPVQCDKKLGPAPHSCDHPEAHTCPVLSIMFRIFGCDVKFQEVVPLPSKKLNFSDLDENTQQLLSDIIERDIFTFRWSQAEEKEVLWEKRHYLHHEPTALAKVLLAAHAWDLRYLPDLYSLVLNWTPPSPQDALVLLLPSFPDTVVRTKAVEWLRNLGSDELISYLPQLVQAVKHEAWDVSAISEMLLERSLTSPRLAHHLYWLLNQCLPLQTNMSGERELVTDARYHRRLNLVTRALMAICGKNMEKRLLLQEAALRTLYAAAMKIKDIKDSQRMHVLASELTTLNSNLQECPTSLPLSPSLEVAGVNIPACAYFTSFTLPLQLSFQSSEPGTEPIYAIFKVGDDLRQDMLVIQMIRLMDKLWLRDALDLKMVTFSVVPTGDKIGIIEMVKDAETLRKIHTEHGVTGSFQDRPLAEWLARHNPSQLEYQRAVENFTASCAGYCVATYILGICDRHNDNIMVKTSGHLFHIDFGKFLGEAQKFGNFKRDRTPFVLTADMAYVINGGEKLTDKFQGFVDLCCSAFNIIRHNNGHLLLYLFALMASSNIHGVTWDAVQYVQKALLQDRTNAEAGAFFAKMIQESLRSWFTQVNFFIHNLAQLRFSGDHDETVSLSFIPKTFTMAQDGRIRCVRLYSYQKRYNPNKYYVYILEIKRCGHTQPSYLFRSYKEFSEFHQKLCYLFPLSHLYSLPKGLHIGRSEVKEVAEKRKLHIELFLSSLFSLADEIAHSDLVYTFFHPLLRDQEDADIHIKKLKHKESKSNLISVGSGAILPGHVQGQVKLSLQYLRGQLEIMVHHARNLSYINSQEPTPYVKLYLLPDPQKRTKRKTKVIKKTCHPTFMEMITYRIPMEVIQQRILEVSVWSEDKFSENVYLGSAYLMLASMNLRNDICEWYSLEHRIHTAREHRLHFNI